LFLKGQIIPTKMDAWAGVKFIRNQFLMNDAHFDNLYLFKIMMLRPTNLKNMKYFDCKDPTPPPSPPPKPKQNAVKWSQIRRTQRLEQCMREIILCFEMNL
jgi:hypothetical protein